VSAVHCQSLTRRLSDVFSRCQVVSFPSLAWTDPEQTSIRIRSLAFGPLAGRANLQACIHSPFFIILQSVFHSISWGFPPPT